MTGQLDMFDSPFTISALAISASVEEFVRGLPDYKWDPTSEFKVVVTMKPNTDDPADYRQVRLHFVASVFSGLVKDWLDISVEDFVFTVPNDDKVIISDSPSLM